MKPASEVLAEARADGVMLSGNEATVRLAEIDESPRIWLGYLHEGLPVAYFESSTGTEVDFSVSQVISVRSVVVDDETDSGIPIPAVRVMCHDARLDRVFCFFIDEVRERIRDGAIAVDVIQSSAAAWRSLLQIATSELSDSQAAGIYGELRFLLAAVEAIGPDAIDAWQRSPHDMHDFTTERSRVEVKASAFQNRSAVTIHGLRQLEPPASGTLTLAVAEIQKHGDESISDVADRLRGLGVRDDVLIERLRDAGYVDGMLGSEGFSFTLRSWRYWEIDSETPVLNRSAVHESVADAVASLSYSLNLSALGVADTEFDFHRFEMGVEQSK
ncbi:PD-(D/E)XK motif protein [Agrococcus casei]|uniref:PD-(D/E)XK motif protein n=1 Tax=Microbacteriaceae TaxID=85023 RepID=UPI003F8FEC80